MSKRSSAKVVGCLVDVSGSMSAALQSVGADEVPGDRLRAVLRAALKVAQAEQQRHGNTLIFVGAFGLNSDKCPAVVDLCGVIDALLVNQSDGETGHELLIKLAKREKLGYIDKYIVDKFSDDEARIIHTFLQAHPHRVDDFVRAIPSKDDLQLLQIGNRPAQKKKEGEASDIKGPLKLTKTAASWARQVADGIAGSMAAKVESSVVDRSEAIMLAHRMRNEWWQQFADFKPRKVEEVISLLGRLEGYSIANDDHFDCDDKQESPEVYSLLDLLRPFLYGHTPMKAALNKAMLVFQEHADADQKVLVIISDGMSTDGDPLPIARELQQTVTLATVFLTDDRDRVRRRLFDQKARKQCVRDKEWFVRHTNLFDMASTISTDTHPIPLLASMGWEVPLSGNCSIFAIVSSAALLDEFCSMLVSAKLGSSDVLLDIVGRLEMDKIISVAHEETRRRGSDQQRSPTCYAHAIAAALNMALVRIEGREEGWPKFDVILKKVTERFPAYPDGQSFEEVLKEAITWYRPLRYQKVDENGARKAVLHRRPVLATFCLSQSGWIRLGTHFGRKATCYTVLRRDQMKYERTEPGSSGHAVVLTKCASDSLTFLNSWGPDWGDGGSFSIEDHTVLELDGDGDMDKMCFYDIYWYEEDLTATERQAYQHKVNQKLRDSSGRRCTILELEVQCPLCKNTAPIEQYTGNIRNARCPLKSCDGSFKPETEHLIKALYARAGL
jgi:hypothetical protein